MAAFDDIFGGGGAAPIWVSGTSYAQFQRVIDPVDGRLFFRRTSAGAGTTRPALDFNNYSLPGFPPVTITKITPRNINNTLDTNSIQRSIETGGGTYASLTGSSSYVTFLTFSGRGVVDFFAGSAFSNGPVIQWKLTIDDVIVYTDASSTSSGALLIGGLQQGTDGSQPIVPEDVFFSRNFKVEGRYVSSSTQSFVYGYRYKLFS